MLRKYLIGFALLFLSEIGFGLTFVIGSVLTKRCGVSADVLAFGRFAIAGLVLLGFLCVSANGRAALLRPRRRDWLTMAWLGPVGTSIMAWCVFVGCSRVSVANASMADALTPLTIFVTSAVLTRRMSLGEFSGVCCGFVGAMLVSQVLCCDGFVLEAYTQGDVFIFPVPGPVKPSVGVTVNKSGVKGHGGVSAKAGGFMSSTGGGARQRSRTRARSRCGGRRRGGIP